MVNRGPKGKGWVGFLGRVAFFPGEGKWSIEARPKGRGWVGFLGRGWEPPPQQRGDLQGERCKLPQRGSMVEPGANRFWYNLC